MCSKRYFWLNKYFYSLKPLSYMAELNSINILQTSDFAKDNILVCLVRKKNMFKMTPGIPQAGNLSSNCTICKLSTLCSNSGSISQGRVYTGGPAKSLGMHRAINLSPSTKPSPQISILS